jgi:hypothetical protein
MQPSSEMRTLQHKGYIRVRGKQMPVASLQFTCPIVCSSDTEICMQAVRVAADAGGNERQAQVRRRMSACLQLSPLICHDDSSSSY